ncbi:MAG: RNA polymerase sigma-70 factor (ECF subfamily) [Myxococcota bacterium]|jgi:RNA polymerase sigma-70 factor (ECF subfamily)
MNLTDAELTDLYERTAHVVYHRCLRILKNEEQARDAVHEVYARVLIKGHQFRGESAPMTWLYRIATNYCLNQLRNQQGRRKKLAINRLDIVGDGFSSPSQTDRADLNLVTAMLNEVDPETRQCVMYTFFDDCTRQEVADLVGVSVPTVRKRIRQFLERARRQLGVSIAAVVSLLFVLGFGGVV